jgi:hypothetical protein
LFYFILKTILGYLQWRSEGWDDGCSLGTPEDGVSCLTFVPGARRLVGPTSNHCRTANKIYSRFNEVEYEVVSFFLKTIIFNSGG